VLGGGYVPGSVTLLTGEPGIGKSTLLLQALVELARRGASALLVSAEESKQQVRLRAERLGALHDHLWITSDTAVPHIVEHVGCLQPDHVVIDSIQTIHDPALTAAPGSVSQVRHCAAELVTLAKRAAISTVLVGHVTKDGSVAGPRVLEHMVDTVLAFEGDRHHALRVLRARKHRFGSTSEVGVFEMRDKGLCEVPDPSALFLADRQPGLPGSAVATVMEGNRAVLLEVQALVVDSAGIPRRSVQGLDANRVALLLAVVEQRCHVPLAKSDVFVSAAGGARVTEPGVDLAVGLALASARSGHAVPADVVACGEVGLGGELRQVAHTERRLAEAARVGFTRAVVPLSAPPPPTGMRALRASTLAAAVELVREGAQ
jgi:DNA repair protein RadA/Sms